MSYYWDRGYDRNKADINELHTKLFGGPIPDEVIIDGSKIELLEIHRLSSDYLEENSSNFNKMQTYNNEDNSHSGATVYYTLVNLGEPIQIFKSVWNENGELKELKVEVIETNEEFNVTRHELMLLFIQCGHKLKNADIITREYKVPHIRKHDWVDDIKVVADIYTKDDIEKVSKNYSVFWSKHKDKENGIVEKINKASAIDALNIMGFSKYTKLVGDTSESFLVELGEPSKHEFNYTAWYLNSSIGYLLKKDIGERALLIFDSATLHVFIPGNITTLNDNAAERGRRYKSLSSLRGLNAILRSRLDYKTANVKKIKFYGGKNVKNTSYLTYKLDDKKFDFSESYIKA